MRVRLRNGATDLDESHVLAEGLKNVCACITILYRVGILYVRDSAKDVLITVKYDILVAEMLRAACWS